MLDIIDSAPEFFQDGSEYSISIGEDNSTYSLQLNQAEELMVFKNCTADLNVDEGEFSKIVLNPVANKLEISVNKGDHYVFDAYVIDNKNTYDNRVDYIVSKDGEDNNLVSICISKNS
ncbi:hypothetical protein BIY23_02825 [Wolbachia pipientis]|uniref:Uncharacterized protein n=1 Tax=Wolbachia pipientis TaxID=955 RepID=A0A1E7QJH4_WOLPI|nr:hypothetical protein [Wolbachia pipientis]OEY86615.1 hypothetical protein BIY23_02825 [Wolbachia pipientis]